MRRVLGELALVSKGGRVDMMMDTTAQIDGGLCVFDMSVIYNNSTRTRALFDRGTIMPYPANPPGSHQSLTSKSQALSSCPEPHPHLKQPEN